MYSCDSDRRLKVAMFTRIGSEDFPNRSRPKPFERHCKHRTHLDMEDNVDTSPDSTIVWIHVHDYCFVL